MSFRFQFRRGTTAERNASNPILAAGEPAVVLDSGQPAELVLGDGVTAMADLRAAVWDDDARLALADTATQPGDLGTAAAANVADLATAAQGARIPSLAQPDSDLSFTTIAGATAVPFAVGTDGTVYASAALGSAVMVRSATAFATVETGPDFAALGSTQTLIYGTRVAEGYVAVLSKNPLNGTPGSYHQYSVGAEIWFSTSFTSGWSKVKDIGRTQGLAIARPEVDPATGSTVLLVGEYSQTAGTTHHLWGSFNGGQTWTALLSPVAVDGANNNHFHGSAFDPIIRRIWTSHGDGLNAYMAYSDDLGATWTAIPGLGIAPTASAYHQPVLVQPLRAGIAVTPDGADGYAGMWMMDRRTTYNVAAYIDGTVGPPDQYAEAPCAVDSTGDVIYTVHPERGAMTTNVVYVLASGDGGRTWHKVYTAAQAADEFYHRGIVGPDAQGRLYLHRRDNTNTTTLLTAPALSWTTLSPTLVRAVGGDIVAVLVAAGLLDPSGAVTLDLKTGVLTAGFLNLTGQHSSITLGAGSGDVGVVNTKTGTLTVRFRIGGTEVWEYTAGEMFLRDGKHLKFGSTTGSMIGGASWQKLGFWGSTPIVKPTVTGSRASGAALASLLTALASAGLITDSTSA